MSISGLKDVSITTNGIYLKEHLENILSAGVKRLNISLDSLRRDRYRQITGFDGFDRVHEAIGLAHRMGFHPIKINMVVLDGINDDEVLDFARLSGALPISREIHRIYAQRTCYKQQTVATCIEYGPFAKGLRL